MRARLVPRVATRLGRWVSVDHIRLGWGRARLERVVVRGPRDATGAALLELEAAELILPWRALWGRGWRGARVALERPRWRLWRDRDGNDNFSDLRARWTRGPAGPRAARRAGEAGEGIELELRDGALRFDDQRHGLRGRVQRINAHGWSSGAFWVVADRTELTLSGWRGRVSLERVRAERRTTDARLGNLPRLRIEGGRAELIAPLTLSGIKGTIVPGRGGEAVELELSGSYGGATTTLWRATGSFDRRRRSGDLLLEAARFELARIREVLRTTPVIQPDQTTIDGRLLMRYEHGRIGFAARLAVDDLNLFHPGLARSPVLDLSARVALAGTYAERRLELSKLEVEARGLSLALSGSLDRSGERPVLEARLVVPALPCQAALDAVPLALVPRLEGFRLGGNLAADLALRIDFARLDELSLRGRLGIDVCQVLEAPGGVRAERFAEDFEHLVEVRPDEWLTVPVGRDNPDFVPLQQVSPYLISALLTTEDAAFFRHRGFILSQFEKALARNLAHGSFRLGASTITMQTVKNLLLSPEKTLARKLQELFLVWYLEQSLSKERLMEIYLNIIELGPGIYGIGAAARHYFGKPAGQLTPLEAAFIASILPAPRRRFVHWCRGALDARWDRYVRRVLNRVCGKGLIDPTACAAAATQSLVFARDPTAPTAAACEQQVEETERVWQEARRRRLVEAIRHAAPDKLPLYAP